MLALYDPKLGKPLPERSYGEDCWLFTPEHPTSSMANFTDAVFDVHFIAHLMGWWFKVLIIRDNKICWICSILFEILELTFRHWLPNFHECWWDHVTLHSNLLAHFRPLWLQLLRHLTGPWNPQTLQCQKTVVGLQEGPEEGFRLVRKLLNAIACSK